MAEDGRYEGNGGGFHDFGGAAPSHAPQHRGPRYDAFGDPGSQFESHAYERESLKGRDREKDRVEKGRSRDIGREHERERGQNRDRGRERDRHHRDHRDHRDRPDRREHVRDRADGNDFHRSRDHDRRRDYERNREGRPRHRSRSPSRNKSGHRSRSRSRSSSKRLEAPMDGTGQHNFYGLAKFKPMVFGNKTVGTHIAGNALGYLEDKKEKDFRCAF